MRRQSRARPVTSRRHSPSCQGNRARSCLRGRRASARHKGARQIGDQYAGIIELLALTGQRREEVAQMQWEELDISHQAWTIPKARTKNAKAHIVHLSNQSLTVLKRQNNRGPYVFSVRGTKPFRDFSKAKAELDRLSGVTGWRLHDLRRTCVSGMAALASPRTWRTRFSIISRAPFQESRRYISGTNSSRSERRRSTGGERT